MTEEAESIVTSTSSQASAFGKAPSRPVFALDRLGSAVAVLIGIGLFAAPFATYRANRIVSGEPRMLLDSLPQGLAYVVLAVALAVAATGAFVRRPVLRLAVAALGLAVAVPVVGLAADFLTSPGNGFARVSPAFGFWLLVLAFGLLVADSLTRLRLGPWARLAALAVAAAFAALLLFSGAWDGLSILKEYATRAESFWREARQHLVLSLGSLLAAMAVGLPAGILCHWIPRLKSATLQVLNVIQTVPSIALFGILMVPLGYVAASVPFAAALGIHGIGATPALIALFLYSLLPLVANTVVGLGRVSADVIEAARGMGLSRRQSLVEVELPLALPVILAGIRIALVQNLGLATVAALIGGGGFGTFVFQGIGQTAIDLVLLGAIPTVALAFAAAVILDAAIELANGTPA